MIWTLSSGWFTGERTGVVLLPLLAALFPRATPAQLDIAHEGVRKLAHFAEYLILGVLLYRALHVERRSSLRAAVLAVALAALYAASDELHQSFVRGRHASPVDCAIDSVGLLIGLLAWQRAR